MLKGQRWWWYAVAGGLLIAQLASPTVEARHGVLVFAWLWPVLVWSQMGSREARYATQSLIFSSEGALTRQLPAVWIAGVVLALLTGGGFGLRALLAADWHSFVPWLTGAAFHSQPGARARRVERIEQILSKRFTRSGGTRVRQTTLRGWISSAAARESMRSRRWFWLRLRTGGGGCA